MKKEDKESTFTNQLLFCTPTTNIQRKMCHRYTLIHSSLEENKVSKGNMLLAQNQTCRSLEQD